MGSKATAITVDDINRVEPELRYNLLRRAALQLRHRYLELAGAVAVGFGRRQKRGTRLHTGDWCIKFVVLRKLKRLPKHKFIPSAVDLKISVDKQRYRLRLKTDIVAFKPVFHGGIGAAIFNAHADSNLGSAAAQVSDGKRSYIMTAGHVAARNTSVSPAVLGEEILTTNGNKLGNLRFAPTIGDDALDGALVEMDQGRDSALPRLSVTSVTEIAPKHEIGAETPYGFKILSWRTEVDARFVGWLYDYFVDNYYAAGRAVFRELIHFEAGCVRGDSGALAVDAKGRAVAMHIMGTDASDRPKEYVALAVPMETLCARLCPGVVLKVTK